MSRFKVGERVTITTSHKSGVIRSVFEDHSNWVDHGSEFEYSVELDNAEGMLTVVEKVLAREHHYYEKRCECGVSSVRDSGNRHSEYCPLYSKYI